MKKEIKGLRVLIFGGSGFIGKAAIRAFEKHGAKVTGAGHTDYDILTADIRKLEQFVKGQDVIVNLAAVVNAHDTEASSESEIVNTEFPRQLMEALIKVNPKARVVFSSSQTVYGETGNALVYEESPVAPKTLYARQKREAEKIFEKYAADYQPLVTILRLANVYGPGSPGNRSVISLFVERALADQEISVFGEGRELRDYVYIDDAAEAIVAAAASSLTDIIYNVGSGEFHCLKEIAENVTRQAGKGKIIYKPFPPGYARYHGHIKLDSTAFKKETGWKPETTLDEGLKKMLK